MKPRMMTAIGVLMGVICCSYGDENSPSNAVRVVLRTLDGSSIVGIPVQAAVAVETVFGQVSVPFGVLKGIEREPGVATSTLQFVNGDRLSGVWQDHAFSIKTAFGDQQVPQDMLRSVSITAAGTRAGLVLHYTFDGDDKNVVFDKSGSEHNGTVLGARYVPNGKMGGAYQVGKHAGFIQVPDQEAWKFDQKPFSISLWFMPGALPYGEQMIIAHNEGGGERNKWALEILNGNLCFHINTINSESFRIALSPWTPQVGRWYHLAVTRSDSTYKVYIDGACVATDVNHIPIPRINVPLTIGQGEGLYIEGLIDEVMIFERALMPEELRQLSAIAN